jgi:hypothetical protein
MKLDDIKKEKDLFATPEGYFDDLPMRVQARVAQAEKPAKWVLVWDGLKLKYVLPALSLALVAYFFVPTQPQGKLDLNSFSAAQVEEYLMQEAALDDTEVLEQFLKSGKSLDLSEAGVEVPQEWIDEEVDADDLEDYL